MAKIWDGYHGSGSRVFLSRQGAADSRSCFLRDGRMQRKRRRLEGRERERRRGRGGSRGRSGVGGGNGLWRKAEGDAFIIRIAGLFWSPEPFRLFEICSVEGEKERGGIGSYEDVKDGERNSEGKRRRRSLRLAKETREVWMVFEECHVIIGPPFERPFQREAAPPLGSARLGSLPPFRSSGSSRFPQLGFNLRNLTINGRSIFSLSLERCFSKIATFIAPLHISISSRSNFLTNLRR